MARDVPTDNCHHFNSVEGAYTSRMCLTHRPADGVPHGTGRRNTFQGRERFRQCCPVTHLDARQGLGAVLISGDIRRSSTFPVSGTFILIAVIRASGEPAMNIGEAARASG